MHLTQLATASALARQDARRFDGRKSRMQLWGGIECTINRVKDQYFDQHAWSRHRLHTREDLELIASLGIRTLRTALHWEFFEASGWDFFDGMLHEMRRLELEPIAGLVHHGSGPLGTDLLDPAFPEKLAVYAAQVAQRYPEITRYTPVNEPHTTARFSCLYGHWYPHHRDIASYLRALLHEVKATVLSMRAIRQIQPAAEFVYTEDGGSVFGTARLESFRVEREARRWLGTDLLCGRVTPDHLLHGYLLKHGITAAEIGWFHEQPCPPAVLGFNYYPTSDRFLDHRVDLYPDNFRGGDTGAEPLVDIEAIRVYPAGIAGVGGVLREAWQRYGIPVAVTEAHLGGDPADQVRWLAEMWKDAAEASAAGVDVAAVTVWALLGSWNWSNLCTRDIRNYEAGVFRIEGGARHRTPLADFVAELAGRGASALPADATVPWWHHPDRITYQGADA
ncbi:family 1 glycosylhydrolase [Terriglobus sp.]|uniref:family 1 glycosylhydrolase n=1 Tax=Terriglobus sp. TaxID=1889013 RepID=UPI003AFFE05D